MSGPHFEDSISPEEMRRILRRELDQIQREADLLAGVHHEPPRTMPDDEGVGAEDGE